jgi:hypothetical protein
MLGTDQARTGLVQIQALFQTLQDEHAEFADPEAVIALLNPLVSAVHAHVVDIA